MTNLKTSCVYGIIGGLVLYILEFFCSSLPYIRITEIGFNMVFFLSVLLGSTTMIVVMDYKNPPFLQTVWRFFMLLASYIGIDIFNGYTGIVRIVYEALDFHVTSGNDNVSGMLTLAFISSVTLISAVGVIAIYLIRRFVEKLHKND